uniref:WW domain-containing protein n=2 Tax=Emiliania huxleyi TaxID=2903 RepID=A0A0D3JD67_EMIH1
MSQLSGLAEMSLEKWGQGGAAGEPPRLAYRRADSALQTLEGVWKKYVKADGRKWYYNTETRVMQWTVPEPFCKLDGAPARRAARPNRTTTDAPMPATSMLSFVQKALRNLLVSDDEALDPPPVPEKRVAWAGGPIVTSDRREALLKLLVRKAAQGVALTADQQRALDN